MSGLVTTKIGYGGVEDPELRAFIDRVADTVRVEMIQGIGVGLAAPGFATSVERLTLMGEPTASPGVAEVVADQVASLSEDHRAALRFRFGRRGTFDRSLATFVRASGIDVRTSSPAIEQVDVAVQFADLVPLFDRVRPSLRPDRSITGGRPAPEPSAPSGLVLRLDLDRVVCVDETNPEWWGSDRIAVGATFVDDKGATSKLDEFEVGDSFEDGDAVAYQPPRVLKEFLLDGAYPKTFVAMVAMAEKDLGGFSAFLQKLWEAIEQHVQKILDALGAAAGAWLGAKIGGTLGTAVGGPLGTIIGIAAGLVLGALVGFLVQLAQDDVFEPQMAVVNLTSADAIAAQGSVPIPVPPMTFYDFGGQYRTELHWELVA